MPIKAGLTIIHNADSLNDLLQYKLEAGRVQLGCWLYVLTCHGYVIVI